MSTIITNTNFIKIDKARLPKNSFIIQENDNTISLICTGNTFRLNLNYTGNTIDGVNASKEDLIEYLETNSFKGGGGDGSGSQGESAYQIAVRNGFEGTETEWLESLNGQSGSSTIEGVQTNALDLGFIGDGFFDNTSIFNNVLTDDMTIVFPTGDYKFNSSAQIKDLSNITLIGGIRTRFLYSGNPLDIYNGNAIINHNGTIKDLKYKNIEFVCTGTNIEEIGGGVVNFSGHLNGDLDLDGLTIEDCKFRNPTVNSNSISFLFTANTRVKNIKVLNCKFLESGRMAVEFVNHLHDGVFRYENCEFRSNDVENTGLIGTWGCGFSFSGDGKAIQVVTCNFKELGRDHCIEFVGVESSTIMGCTAKGINKGFNFFSSGWRRSKNISVTGNVVEIPSMGSFTARGFSLGNAENIQITNNSFIIDEYCELKGCVNCTVTNNTIVTKDHCAVWIKDASVGNKIWLNTLDSSGFDKLDRPHLATVFINGAGTTNNEILNNTIIPPEGGTAFAELDTIGNIFPQD